MLNKLFAPTYSIQNSRVSIKSCYEGTNRTAIDKLNLVKDEDRRLDCQVQEVDCTVHAQATQVPYR